MLTPNELDSISRLIRSLTPLIIHALNNRKEIWQAIRKFGKKESKTEIKNPGP